MTDQAIEVAAALARRWEGLYLRPYTCPAGVPTVGYGATYYEDGTAVTLRDPAITKERAEILLLWALRNRYLPEVMRLCPGVTEPNRLGALVDFAFNVGATKLAGSTLRRKVNAGEWDDVPDQLRRWAYAGGRKLNGLALRREAEAALI